MAKGIVEKMKGLFITFEGSEGSGKSTQIALLQDYLKSKKINTLFLREPGGVNISEKIRDILLDVKSEGMCSECETLLYMSARAQLIDEVIEPALKKGQVILCDRFLDSTIAYQGYGNGIDVNKIKKIGEFVTRGIKPDLTLIFDIDPEKGLSRIPGKKDRIEQRNTSYHKKVRAGYLDIAKKNKNRVKIIKVNKSIEEIHEVVRKYVDKCLVQL